MKMIAQETTEKMKSTSKTNLTISPASRIMLKRLPFTLPLKSKAPKSFTFNLQWEMNLLRTLKEKKVLVNISFNVKNFLFFFRNDSRCTDNLKTI